MAFPSNPGLHLQVKAPGPVCVHMACSAQGLLSQGSISVHVNPSPLKPSLQLQLNLAGPVFVQNASNAHGPLSQAFISAHDFPSPK
jgi:hypothetical protein